MIKVVHTGPDASKATHDDAGGLEPVVFLARGARVMLCANIWVEVGLVNGALGTVVAICYKDSLRHPDLPVSVMVMFDEYAGPTRSNLPTLAHLVFHHKAMLTPSAASEAVLGCHHTQVPGIDT